MGYKKMKKFISVLLCICLCLSITACGANNEARTTDGTTESEKNTEIITTGVTSLPTENSTTVTTTPTEIPSYGNDSQIKQNIRNSLERERASISDKTAVLTFTGDCTLGTYPECEKQKTFDTIYKKANSLTYPFDLVKDWFEHDDRTIINFEGTLTESNNASNKQWRFKGPASYGQMVVESSIETACLANNHSFDYGQQGYTDTVNNLRKSGIDVVEDGKVTSFTSKDIGFSILAYDLRHVTQSEKDEKKIQAICKQIIKAKEKSDIVILFMHWGTEYKSTPDNYQTSYARRMADAGADLIIGNHPHTLQGIEQYNGTYICYALGNFAFGGNATVPNSSREVMMVRAYFEKTDSGASCTNISIVPCYESSAKNAKINNYQPMPLFGEEAKKVRNRVLSLSSNLPNGVKEIRCDTIG